MSKWTPPDQQRFVGFMREASPYLRAHRDQTFVVYLGGDAIEAAGFPLIVQDLALLCGIGVKLVLVHGARPQIAEQLAQRDEEPRVEKGIPVTNKAALLAVKEAVGMVRVEIESLLSTGVANSPMEGARLHVDSGNFVTAMPVGVRDGVDGRVLEPLVAEHLQRDVLDLRAGGDRATTGAARPAPAGTSGPVVLGHR